MKRLKPYLRWLILGLTLFFLLHTLRSHWQEVAAVRIDHRGWQWLAAALVATSLAHCWSAWIWVWMLDLFRVKLGKWEAIALYLKTNLSKYLPGNIWHFYGRMVAVVESGSSWGIASLSVLLEPLLMAAAALLIAFLGLGIQAIQAHLNPVFLLFPVVILIGVLGGIQPRILNPIIHKISKGKTQNHDPVQLEFYPLSILAGEMGFVLLKSIGFLCIWAALFPLNMTQLPQLIGLYAGAWLMGLIVPGAPGGLGVFEATAIALLGLINPQNNLIPTGTFLSIIALLRLISIVAEIIPVIPSFWRSRSQ